MKKLTSLVLLSVISFVGYAGDDSAIAYNLGKLLGNLILIGIVILIIWLIVRAVRRNKSK